MKNDLNLTDFLKDVFSSFDKKVENSGLVSICVEIPYIDLFQVYELFINKYSFSSFWEEADGISYIAFEKCKYVTLDGPKRFELAKEFNSENFKNLINLTYESHNSALSKIIYSFCILKSSQSNFFFILILLHTEFKLIFRGNIFFLECFCNFLFCYLNWFYHP